MTKKEINRLSGFFKLLIKTDRQKEAVTLIPYFQQL